MYSTHTVSVENINAVLKEVESQQGGRRCFLQVRNELLDHGVARCDLTGPPSVSYGQACSIRHSVDRHSAVHLHLYDGYVVAHRDRYDPKVRPVEHLVQETKAPQGAVLGGLAGLALGFATGGIALAALGGAFLAANTPDVTAPLYVVTCVDCRSIHWERRGSMRFQTASAR